MLLVIVYLPPSIWLEPFEAELKNQLAETFETLEENPRTEPIPMSLKL